MKHITRFAIVAVIVTLLFVVMIIKFAFNMFSGLVTAGVDATKSIINVTSNGVNIADYIKIDDDGIIIGGSNVDFSEIGEKVSDGLKNAGIEVSENMSGSIIGDVSETGFKQNRYSFSAEVNRALDIKVYHCDVIIAAGDSDFISVDVLENDNFKYDLSTVDNTLQIRDKSTETVQKTLDLFGWSIPLGSTVKQNTYTGLAMIIYLPKSFSGEINLSTTDADIKLGNLTLTDSLLLSTTNGNAELTNIEADELMLSTTDGRITLGDIAATEVTVTTTNDRVSLSNITSKRLDVSTTGAAIDFSRLFGEKFSFETTGADITGSILGQETLFAITTETDGTAYPKSSENSRAQYKLSAITSDGDIAINFIN